MQITLENYKKLLTKIQKTITKTKQNIVKSVDRQKVEMSWEIGRDIEAHLKNKTKADYGEELFKRLTDDTSIEKTTLYQMRAFYKAYPKLPSSEKVLSWSHYRNLIAVKDAETRQQLEGLVIEKGLGANKLQQAISKTKKVSKKNPKKNSAEIPQLRVTRGQLFTYKITENGEADLGFNVFVEKGVLKNSASKMVAKVKSDYTYKAELERVVDGDTLHVKIDLGFGIKHREILRLAKINAPEMKTPEGKKSSDALKKILKDVKLLVVKTNKTDIYGRYVADVFFEAPSGSESTPGATKGVNLQTGKEKDLQKIAGSGIYLSQLLLDRGLVEVY